MSKKDDYSYGYLITKLGRILTQLYSEQLEAIGITPLQGGILVNLAPVTSLSQKDLMTRLHVDKGTIHQMLKGLAKKNLISMEKSKTDRRYLEIEITPKGKALIPKIAEIDETVSNQFISSVDSKHRKIMHLALTEAFKSYSH